MSITVAGIHTGIGKTMASAILVKALGYDYWKPVQAGELDNTDSDFIRRYALTDSNNVHPEAYALELPASPHYAAEMEGLNIELSSLNLPVANKPIVVETAGGLMSPLNRTACNIDLVTHLNLPTVLVVKDYLGSINHTLLSIELMRQRNVEILGLIFNGEAAESSREYISTWSGLPVLIEIPELKELSTIAIEKIADENKEHIRRIVNGK